MTVVITLMLPARALSPNARNHWRIVSKDKRYYRQMASINARLAHNGQPFKAATCEARFFFKDDKRKRDRDNLLASLKSAFDGLADGGLIENDRDLTHLPVKVGIDNDRPRVELHVTETA